VLDAIPRRSPSVASRTLDGEAVIVHPERGNVIVLNGVGARLWDLMDGQHTVTEIARVVATEYEVSPIKAETDALAFCHDLAGRGLLTLDS
jgi:hypothetical protein